VVDNSSFRGYNQIKFTFKTFLLWKQKKLDTPMWS